MSHPQRLPTRSVGLRRFGRVLAVSAAIFLLETAAAAQTTSPTIAEAVSYARREVNRICDDRDMSYFAGVDDRPVRRSCRARVSRGKLVLQVTFNHTRGPNENEPEAEGDDDDGRLLDRMASFRPEDVHAGDRELAIHFDRRSMFLCGPERLSGFAPLYLNCLAETSVSDVKCVHEKLELWSADGLRRVAEKQRSFALIMSVRQEDCGRLRNALNYVAKRSDPERQRSLDRFFSN